MLDSRFLSSGCTVVSKATLSVSSGYVALTLDFWMLFVSPHDTALASNNSTLVVETITSVFRLSFDFQKPSIWRNCYNGFLTIINGFKRNTKNISQYACPTQAVRKDAHTCHEDDKAGRATGRRAGADHRMDARRQVIDPGTFEFLFP